MCERGKNTQEPSQKSSTKFLYFKSYKIVINIHNACQQTNEDRKAILREILLNSSQTSLTRLPNGIAQVFAEKYNCHHSTIRRVFAKEQGVTTGNMKVSVASRKKGRVGRKTAYTAEQVKAKILQVPLV
ncbi:hypothetical protein DYB37_013859 [Aphanomyces astaci]|uniref:Uncharacterized protein n=1 Tax=Aphanomyces astaci TaxID=112090 RepID=A0A418FTJ7_APHAT|nr:hypothetical protein DYB37_013859 [Aphanomyces astaci]